jgi:DNA modification methylase
MPKTPLVWRTEKRLVKDLLPYEKNPRTISEKQMEDLTKSLKKFGLVETPAIDTDSRIIAGHQRIKVLQLLGRGDEEIDVRIPNRKLTEKEYEQYLLTSNAVGGDWDFEKLRGFDMELLLDIGFSEEDLSSIWDDHLETEDDDFDIEKAISEIREPKTKLGDIYQLGIHRLICGDTTDPEILQKLLKKEKAKMVFSDPVYNIGLSYNTGLSGNKSYGGETNDNKTDAEYKNLLRRSLENALSASESDTHVFYWCDETYIGLVQDIYRELGIENRRVCLWIKNGQNPTPKVAFNKCYEPCVYGIRGKPYLSKSDQSLNEVMNKEVGTGNRLVDDILDLMDIWLVKRLPANEYEHPTSKPPTLYQKAIRRCTKPGDIILDGFGGSGSCLIAGEQLKRKVYLVEIEPVFCDVIIKRYETLTGTKAKKLN